MVEVGDCPSPFKHGYLQSINSPCSPPIPWIKASLRLARNRLRSLDDIPADDSRRSYPCFQPDVFHLNLELVEQLEQIATEKSVTQPQTVVA
ncbi:hypothetical protein BO70DRAFT_400922 [Aspergillus heteromorphus CBS 117.55]|uniref:Uncharacterized protein n=1 Tax=Aspergillus heteromorphus CBS 117.55 TaxID=1448321 RepID=A0A317UZM1_9EURO|nr:uncharacterized protein BO70DRAFT_400922 [Aspergillus heteromorphus CBS 117.55]PWY65972.1 hypothetical protein BO70DRAFT_400922 [Aspergillus heteromorphus CBS 117.55]